jgi:hypothetical protein
VAHAERIAQEVAGVSAKELKGPELVEAMAAAARTVDTERQFYVTTLESRGRRPSHQWCEVADAIVRGIRGSFPDEPVTIEEYLQTAVLYSMRQLSYPFEPLVRVRLCTWLAALYSLGRRYFTAGS